MEKTSQSLLARLQNANDPSTWDRLVAIYTPLLRRWLAKYDVQASDADDLIQEVLIAVSRDVADFRHHGQPGAFRAWLKTILVYRLRNHWRARGRRPQVHGSSDIQRRLSELEDPSSQLSQLWNQQHDRQVLLRLMALAEPHFETTTWKAFRRVVFDRQPASETAAELGISVNSVFIAKSRVLRRLRQESAGLVESSSGFFSNA